jgi:hypothetical protein
MRDLTLTRWLLHAGARGRRRHPRLVAAPAGLSLLVLGLITPDGTRHRRPARHAAWTLTILSRLICFVALLTSVGITIALGRADGLCPRDGAALAPSISVATNVHKGANADQALSACSADGRSDACHGDGLVGSTAGFSTSRWRDSRLRPPLLRAIEAGEAPRRALVNVRYGYVRSASVGLSCAALAAG